MTCCSFTFFYHPTLDGWKGACFLNVCLNNPFLFPLYYAHLVSIEEKFLFVLIFPVSRKSTSSRQEQQLGFLKERMEEFRTAALQAKKNKDLELAKQYIRMMKVRVGLLKFHFKVLQVCSQKRKVLKIYF